MRNLALTDAASWLACAMLVTACSGAGATTTPAGGVPDGGAWRIRTGGPRFGVRAANGNGRPAAVISSVAGGALGQAVQLDGRGSCDPEGGALTYARALLAAPAGSHWPLAGTSTAQATLTPDVAGIYRVAHRVTDSQGAVSDPALLEIQVEEP